MIFYNGNGVGRQICLDAVHKVALPKLIKAGVLNSLVSYKTIVQKKNLAGHLYAKRGIKGKNIILQNIIEKRKAKTISIIRDQCTGFKALMQAVVSYFENIDIGIGWKEPYHSF
jgi:hypothetical protein